MVKSKREYRSSRRSHSWGKDPGYLFHLLTTALRYPWILTECDIFPRTLDQFIKKDREKGVEIRWPFPGMDSLLPKQDFVLHKLTLFEDFDANLKLIQPGSNRNARTARNTWVKDRDRQGFPTFKGILSSPSYDPAKAGSTHTTFQLF